MLVWSRFAFKFEIFWIQVLFDWFTIQVDFINIGIFLVKADSGIVLPRLLVDGGVTSNDQIMQWQADLTGLEVHRPNFSETTVLGAAMSAGRAVGKWNFDIKLDITSQKFKPKITEQERDQRYKKWKMAISRCSM